MNRRKGAHHTNLKTGAASQRVASELYHPAQNLIWLDTRSSRPCNTACG
jgi:hypothetical protein